MGFILDVRFPVTDGPILAGLRVGLVSWSGLVCQRKLPDTKARRMLTLRNDSGPVEGVIQRRRQGVNVWADDPVDAERICLDAMAYLSGAADGNPVVSYDQFSGPYEVPDDPAYVVGSANLTHFYFTFRASVRGSAA